MGQDVQVQKDEKPAATLPQKISHIDPKLQLEIKSAITSFDSSKIKKFSELEIQRIVPSIKTELETIPLSTCPLQDIYTHFAYFKFLTENSDKLKETLPALIKKEVASLLSENRDLSKKTDNALVDYRQRLVNISYYSELTNLNLDNLKDNIQSTDEFLKERFLNKEANFDNFQALFNFISNLEQLNFSYAVSESAEVKIKAPPYKNKIQEVIAKNTPTAEQISEMPLEELENITLKLVYLFLKFNNKEHTDLLKKIDRRVREMPLEDLEKQINSGLESYKTYTEINKKAVIKNELLTKDNFNEIDLPIGSLLLRIFPKRFDPKLHKQVFNSMAVSALLEQNNKIKIFDEIIFTNAENALTSIETAIDQSRQKNFNPKSLSLMLNHSDNIYTAILKMDDLIKLSSNYNLFVLNTGKQ